MRSRILVAALIVAALSGACTTKDDQLGTGADVGFCGAWVEFDSLEAPTVTDKRESEVWASALLRILDRVDLRSKVDEKAPSAAVAKNLRVVEGELREYRDAVRDADAESADALRRASAELAAGPFDSATLALTRVNERDCTREERAG